MIPGAAELAWAVCAREPGHLLLLGEHNLAFCARCTAWYGGMGLTAVVLLLARRGRRTQLSGRMVSLCAIGFLVLMGTDALLDGLGWRNASLLSRVASGSLAGAGLPILLMPLMAGLSSRPEKFPLCSSWEALGLGMLSGLQAVCLALSPGWTGGLARAGAVYFTSVAMVGMGFLLYSVSRLVLAWLAHRRSFDSWWGAWLLAGAVMAALYLWHTLSAGSGG